MNGQNSKAKEILLGIATGIGLWIFGHLLSGRLSFVEDIELYPTGPLVFLFPFVFIAACILVAKYSAKNGRDIYFKSSLICCVLPMVCLIISFIVEFIMRLRIPVISITADFMQLIFVIPSVPAVSIFYQMFLCLGFEFSNAWPFLITVSIILIIAGFIISIKIYKNKLEIS